MKTNLSSQISLHRVSPRYYRPENAFEKSVLTRLEKIPTDIYESVEEGANYIAREIAQTIREKQKAGRFCVLALPGGDSPRHVYTELIRMHKEEGLSFRNVIVFNMYEYYPLAPDAVNSNFNALKNMLLDHIDIDRIYSLPTEVLPKIQSLNIAVSTNNVSKVSEALILLYWVSAVWVTSHSTNRVHA